MPGLNQLKSFNENLKDLGDEINIRAQRGEKPAEVPLPEGISEADDSEDFVLGLPENNENKSDSAPAEEVPLPEALAAASGLPEGGDNVPDLDSILNPQPAAGDGVPDLSDFLDEPAPEAQNAAPAEVPLEDMGLDALLKPSEDTPSPSDIPDISDLAEMPSPEELEMSAAEEPAPEAVPEAPAEENPQADDFAFSGEMIDMNEGLPDEVAETDAGSAVMDDVLPAGDTQDSAVEEAPVPLDTPPVFDMSDLDMPPAEPAGDSAETDFSIPDLDAPPVQDSGEPGFDNVPVPPAEDVSAAFDTSGLDFPEAGSAPDASMDVPAETFDTSAMEGLDFSSEGSQGSSASGDDEFPVTMAKDVDDFVLDDNFEIPGFSDTETANFDKKKKPAIDTADFSQAVIKPKNTLTEKEYETFKKNLNEYPLNVRVAVEDLIVKNEFTDDAVFEVIEKILKKVSARQLATHLEKMLDIAIPVPRDFERRSFAQYEAYKASFQYQLRNRIIPGAIIAVLLCMTGYCLFNLFVSFVYRPVVASNLYEQGYNLLEQNDYEQSEIKFNEAVDYKKDIDWFYKYARGYRKHKQYERAGSMYRKILGTFDMDKQAGLEIAEMKAFDEAKYEEAESLVRRFVLDYYINDPDGIMLLGDINLEWGEFDHSKYENAKRYYTDLVQSNPKSDFYWSRLMRYYIRTDKLTKVLEMKNRFYPREESLAGEDWTELSGYMLDKLYGRLPATEEYLRSSIEDVLGMLKFAVENDRSNPVARYNIARYYIYNGNNDFARNELKRSLDLFDKLEVRTRKNTYLEIDATRLLGELHVRNREYLKAQEIYTKGIDLYKSERAKNGFDGDENTGKLYADLGDINYFISGDMDAALDNYTDAINTKYDIPSLNYRIGVINYNRKDYDKALAYFIRTSEYKNKDANLLLSLGNVLSLRGDNYAAQSYYTDLLNTLNVRHAAEKSLQPQGNKDDFDLVDKFLKVNNNLGVTLYRIAEQTGDSNKHGQAITRLQDSLRAWDALTRNQKTMERLEGSNLAQQNIKYITRPYSAFKPSIYTDIPVILEDDTELK